MDLWSVLASAAGRLVRPETPEYRIPGYMGRFAHSATDPPDEADLLTGVIPGLASLGVRADLIPLADDAGLCERLIRDRLRRGCPVPLLRLESGSDAAESGFTHMLRLTHGGPRGGRVAGRMAALLRWTAFVAAHPERAPKPGQEDLAVLEGAARFLDECAGRGPVGTRIGRAAGLMLSSDEAGLRAAQMALREAVLLYLRLPAVAQAALLSDPESALSPLELHELIYLARAGTRDLRLLAAARLAPERRRPEVAATLAQAPTPNPGSGPLRSANSPAPKNRGGGTDRQFVR